MRMCPARDGSGQPDLAKALLNDHQAQELTPKVQPKSPRVSCRPGSSTCTRGHSIVHAGVHLPEEGTRQGPRSGSPQQHHTRKPTSKVALQMSRVPSTPLRLAHSPPKLTGMFPLSPRARIPSVQGLCPSFPPSPVSPCSAQPQETPGVNWDVIAALRWLGSPPPSPTRRQPSTAPKQPHRKVSSLTWTTPPPAPHPGVLLPSKGPTVERLRPWAPPDPWASRQLLPPPCPPALSSREGPWFWGHHGAAALHCFVLFFFPLGLPLLISHCFCEGKSPHPRTGAALLPLLAGSAKEHGAHSWPVTDPCQTLAPSGHIKEHGAHSWLVTDPCRTPAPPMHIVAAGTGGSRLVRSLLLPGWCQAGRTRTALGWRHRPTLPCSQPQNQRWVAKTTPPPPRRASLAK